MRIHQIIRYTVNVHLPLGCFAYFGERSIWWQVALLQFVRYKR